MSRREAVGRLVAPGAVLLSAFITIQSSSPRTSRVSFAGSMCRLAAIEGSESFESLSRVLGLRRLLLADDPQHLVERRAAAAASCRAASCR